MSEIPQPDPQYAAPTPLPQTDALSDSDQRMWSMLAHLGGIVLGFIAPLVVMLVQGEKSPYVRRHAVEALNFNILVTIAYIVSGILIIAIIGLILLPVVWIGSLVFMIMAGLAANKGQDYRYPINLRLVK